MRRLAREDSDPQVQIAAIHAMRRMPDAANLPTLRHVLADAAWLVQAQVVQAIRAHGEAGIHMLTQVRTGAWRSGAIRWVREITAAEQQS